MQPVVVHQVNHWLLCNSTDARHAAWLVAGKSDTRAGAHFHDGGAECVRNGSQFELALRPLLILLHHLQAGLEKFTEVDRVVFQLQVSANEVDQTLVSVLLVKLLMIADMLDDMESHIAMTSDAEAVLAQLACGAAVEAVAVGAALLLCKALARYNCSPNVPHRLLGFSVLERATHGLCVHLGGGDRVGQAEDLSEALRLSES